MRSPTPTVLRVDPATIVIMAVLFSPALLMAGLLFWRGVQASEAVFLCLLYAGALYGVCGQTVELAPGRLVHRIFFRKRIIDVTNVVAAAVVARPAPTLELRREGSRDAVRAFIVKPFTRAGVAAMLLHVRKSSPGVKLEPVAQDMSEGRFDTITRETVKAMRMGRVIVLLLGTLIAAALVRLLRN